LNFDLFDILNGHNTCIVDLFNNVFRDLLSELFVLFGILQITHYLYIVILERLVVLSFLFNFFCVFERDPLLIIWILYL
jgi:hypothetical protein